MADLNTMIPAFGKLLEYFASGVGAVAGPILANWKATQEGKSRLTSASVRAEAEKRRLLRTLRAYFRIRTGGSLRPKPLAS